MPLIVGVIIAALFAVVPVAAAAQDTPPFETTDRLEALDRITDGPATCYSRDQARAFEAMRVHTELMIAGLSCAEVYGNADIYGFYQDFTIAHSDFLTASQRVIEQRDGDRGYDAFRTRIANVETGLISRWGTTGYCRIREARFGSLIFASPDSFRAYVEDLAGRVLASQRGC